MRALILLLGVMWLGGVQAQGRASPKETPAPTPVRDVLVLGKVSVDPHRDAQALQAMVDYVVPRMREVGIREGRILMAEDETRMQGYLRRQKVDWVSDSAVLGLGYQRRAGAQRLLLTERGGALRYHTVFFARRGSGIRSLSSLRGRSVVFQSPRSTSAYVVPAAEMLYAGLEMDLLLSPADKPAMERAGYLFSRRQGNVLMWVHERLVDVGAVSNLDWEGFGRMHRELRDEMEVFHQTLPIPQAVEMVAPGLDPTVRDRLREVLLEASSDPAAKDVLSAFFDTSAFVPIDAQAERELSKLAADLDLVRQRLE